MLKSKQYKAVDGLYHFGCSCCNSKQERRTGKKKVKRQEERKWRKESREDIRY